MAPKRKSSSSKSKSKKAQERRERKALEERIRNCKEKCEEARCLLEPTGRNIEPNFVKAKTILDAAIEIYNGHPPAYFYLGECYRGQEEYNEAIIQYSHVLDLQPNYIRALEGRASCFQGQKDLEHAMEDYTSIIDFEPDNDHAYNMRGLCFLMKRVPGLRMKKADFQSCVSDFKNAIRLNEANYYAMCNLGKVYEDQGEMENAVAAYTSALNVKDDYTAALFRRGSATLRWVEMSLHTQFNVDEYCDNPCALNGSKENFRENKLPSFDDIEEDVRSKIVLSNDQVAISNRINSAVADLVSLLPNPETSNKLAADVTVVLNIAVCYLLKDDLAKFSEFCKYAEDIIEARPGLVEDGQAQSIDDLENIKRVLNLRKDQCNQRKASKTHIDTEK